MAKIKPPVYLFDRTEEEIEQAYTQNNITKYKWEQLKRNPRSFQTPYGYLQSTDPDILEPIPFELDVLEHAKKLLELRDTHPTYRTLYSLRKIADWVTNVTGREISHQGLRVRIDDDYERFKRQEEAIYKRVQEEIRKKAEYANSDTPSSFAKRAARATDT